MPVPRPSEPEEQLGSTADAVIDNVTAVQQEALHSFETAGVAVLDGVSRVQREVAGFVSGRIRKDMETQAALLRCRTLEEVRSVQADFVRTAMDQYATEASLLVKLGGEMVAKSLDRGAE